MLHLFTSVRLRSSRGAYCRFSVNGTHRFLVRRLQSADRGTRGAHASAVYSAVHGAEKGALSALTASAL